ncbi:MAG: hypothetical protein HY319_06220 [Armatimonadetes bacterium]|nr:hypothetical protein [Armatimonadota bacterium]
MKRALLALAAAVLLGTAAQAEAPDLFVNGLKVNAPAVQRAGLAYYSVEDVARAMGVSYHWDAGSRTLTVHGRKLQGSVEIVDGRPYLPFNQIAQAADATYEVDDVRGVIKAQSSSAVVVAQPPQPPPEKPKPRAPGEDDPPTVAPPPQTEEERAEIYRDAGMPGGIWLEEREQRMHDLHFKTRPEVMPSNPPVNLDLEPHPWLVSDKQEAENPPPPRPIYTERSAMNAFYRMAVTDIKEARELKGTQPPAQPRPGHKFVVVYLSLENRTDAPQATGTFGLRDSRGLLHPFHPGLSLFPQGGVGARQICIGYLIAEVPESSYPTTLELAAPVPLSVSLR